MIEADGAYGKAFVTRYSLTSYILEHKKAWRTYLLSIPRTEALALPNPVEQTTSEPTPI